MLVQLDKEGADDRMDGYADTPRLWSAMLEWLAQFTEVSNWLATTGHDVISLVKIEVEAETGKKESSLD